MDQHSRDSAVYWDKDGFYTVWWEETGNNDIPHKEYIYCPENRNRLSFAEENERIRATKGLQIQDLRDWLNDRIDGATSAGHDFAFCLVLKKLDELGL